MCVHALNVLRMILIDATLGPDLDAFIAGDHLHVNTIHPFIHLLTPRNTFSLRRSLTQSRKLPLTHPLILLDLDPPTQPIAECTQLAVQGFKSNKWAIRNSSMMVFSSVVQRAVDNDKNEGATPPPFFSSSSLLRKYNTCLCR